MKSKVQSPRSKVRSPQLKAGGALTATLLFGFGLWTSDFELRATDVPLTPVDNLARRADDVVHGRVASLEASRDDTGRPFTRVELDVLATWKGMATNRFSLVQASSALGPRPVKVLGEPEFRLGEEVIVFTVRNPRGESVTLDLARGKFGVTTNQVTGVVEAANTGLKQATGYSLPGRAPVPLKELGRQVREATK
jgi:hypothetical protein